MKKQQGAENPNCRPVRRFLVGKWHYLIVLIFGMILCVGIWAYLGQIMVGDDYAFHVMRLQSASRAWSNGQIVPQVDPDALNGFGYAYNLFYGPLITYLAAGLQAVVNFWPVAINLLLMVCLIGGGLTMCYAMSQISRKPVLAALVAVFYMTAPYTLNNLYARMALGEVVAFVAVPILLLGLYQLLTKQKHAARSIALSAALLILSHSLSAMLFALAAALFVLFNIRKVLNWENVWRMILGVSVAVGLTAFFTLPLIEAKLNGNYGVFDAGYADVYFGANAQSMNDHRLALQQLLVVDYAGKVNAEGLGGEFGVTLGVVAMIGLLGFWFVRKRIEDVTQRRFVTTLYIIAVVAILMALPVIDWRFLPGILWQMQFPWRMLMVSTAFLAVVAGYTFDGLVRDWQEDRQKVVMVVAGMMAVYLVMPVILPRAERHIDLAEVATDPVTLGWEAEYAPMELLCSPDDPEDVAEGYACSLGRVRQLLEERGEGPRVVSGEVEINGYSKDGLRVDFKVENLSDEVVVIELPMVYYAGYVATLDGEEIAVRSSEQYGLAEVVIPAQAEGEVAVWYGLSRATELGGLISAGTLGLSVVWLVVAAILDRRAHKKDVEMMTLMDSVREVVEENEESVQETIPGPKKSTKSVATKTTKARTKKATSTTGATSAKKVATKSRTAKPKVTKVKAKPRVRKDPE